MYGINLWPTQTHTHKHREREREFLKVIKD